MLLSLRKKIRASPILTIRHVKWFHLFVYFWRSLHIRGFPINADICHFQRGVQCCDKRSDVTLSARVSTIIKESDWPINFPFLWLFTVRKLNSCNSQDGDLYNKDYPAACKREHFFFVLNTSPQYPKLLRNTVFGFL